MQSKAREAFSIKISILLSALFFALFHFSNLVDQGPEQVIISAIMAFFFGLGWGVMTVWARSVVPAMIVHYLVNSVGRLFLELIRRIQRWWSFSSLYLCSRIQSSTSFWPGLCMEGRNDCCR